jgi:ornithine decarboxylase
MHHGAGMKRTKTELKRTIISLAKKHGTPLFIINKSMLIQQVNRFKSLLPGVKPFYAVKANSHPEILKVLAEYGTGFDVASIQEIKAILDLGVKPDRIVFANTVKRPEALKYAIQHGVRLMTFDSEYELNKIAKYAPGAHVMIRIKVPNVGSIVELSLKFGAEPADAIPFLIKAYQLKLKPVGVSFHVGSQSTNVENYLASLEMASIIFKDAKLKQLPLEILDIGGGFPIRYLDHDKDFFSSMSVHIRKELKRLFSPDVQVIAEPGRAIVGPACYLVMTIVGKSIRGNKHWYYLDDGVYGSLSGIIFDHAKYQYRTFRRGVTQITTLAGPTCDSLDIISVSEDMPELEIGDLVYCDNVGAYSWATATSFNGILPAEVVLIP